jgi:hypothetical protein
VIRASAFGLALLFWAAPALAAAGFAAGGVCHSTLAQAAAMACATWEPDMESQGTSSNILTSCSSVQSSAANPVVLAMTRSVLGTNTTPTTATWYASLLIPACDTEDMPRGVEFYAVVGVGILLFFSLMHGFSVGRVST